jgi:hypothetical protein
MDGKFTSMFWTLPATVTALLGGIDKFLELLMDWEKSAGPFVLSPARLSASAGPRMMSGQFKSLESRRSYCRFGINGIH